MYVDTDPQVLVHGRALLEANDRTRVVAADVRNPGDIRSHPDTRELIDFDAPVAVMFSAILHHVNDEEDPAGIVRYWAERVPSGATSSSATSVPATTRRRRRPSRSSRKPSAAAGGVPTGKSNPCWTGWRSSTPESSPLHCGALMRPTTPGPEAVIGNSPSGSASSPPDWPGRCDESRDGGTTLMRVGKSRQKPPVYVSLRVIRCCRSQATSWRTAASPSPPRTASDARVSPAHRGRFDTPHPDGKDIDDHGRVRACNVDQAPAEVRWNILGRQLGQGQTHPSVVDGRIDTKPVQTSIPLRESSP